MRLAISIALMCFYAAAARSDELLTNFHPSATQSENGPVNEVEFATGLVVLDPGTLAHHQAGAMKYVRFPEPVWLIAYHTEIRDARGEPPKENYLCHTFFSDQRVDQHQDQEFSGIYSDAFTPKVNLPDGYGILLPGNERLQWMPMFNNRGDEAVRVSMKVKLLFIRDKDVRKRPKPLFASLRSIQVPHLFFVPPGRDERQISFQLPFDGSIHLLGTHVHPYGVSVDLYNVSRREMVWKGVREHPPDGPMQVYSNLEGYPIRAGETWRITSVYENTTDEKVDAMAGLFILYSRN